MENDVIKASGDRMNSENKTNQETEEKITYSNNAFFILRKLLSIT